MSQVYEVKHVSGPKEWQGSHGPMLSYKLDLDNNGVLERQVELNRKPESRAPAVGELLALDLEETNYGTKAKLDFDRTKELSQPALPTGSSEVKTSSKGSWQPESQRDPERAARILRQHSQGVAIQWLAAEAKGRPIELKDFFGLCNEFDADVNRAGRQARQEPRTEVAQSPETASGSDSPASPDAGDLKDIEMALDCIWVGANAKARERVALYMFSQLEEKDLLRACNQLTNAQDPNTQETTLTAMKARTVKWQGEALPADNTTDESIPF